MCDRLGEHPRGQRANVTGPNPTDRGEKGSKIHLICDRNGLPISLGVSAANVHDSLALRPLVRGIPPIRSRPGPRRRRPGKLHADKGYDYGHCADGFEAEASTPGSPAAVSTPPAAWAAPEGAASADITALL